MTITEFLLARIEEREARINYLPDPEVVLNAHGNVSARGDGWVTRGDCDLCGQYMFDGNEVVTEEAWWRHREEAHERPYVLAECEAKRRIVEHYADLAQAWDTIADALDDGFNEGGDDGEDEDVLPLTLRLLALPYADHPDYDPAWALDG